MKYLLTMVCLLAAFSSCINRPYTDDIIHIEIPQGRTVLVYISAENSLNDFLDNNLNQMVKGSQNLSKDDHLIAFIDRADKNEMPYIAEIANGEIKKVKKFENDIIASDPREMRDIIKWTATNYPAEDYGLVLWGHASAWLIEDSVDIRKNGPKRAFGIDNGNNNTSDRGKWMNTPSMAKCIQESGVKFKFIFADICCFQCVENAYELRNVTQWIIGSPAEIPADGAPYDAIMPYIFSKESDFYIGIIDEYEKAYANRQYDGITYSVPLSAVETVYMESLADVARTKLWKSMLQSWPNADNVIYYFGRYSPAGREYDRNPIGFDALDIVWANTSSDDIRREWFSALTYGVVPYSSYDTSRQWMTSGHVKFSDFTMSSDRMALISMFVPLERYENSGARYNEMITHMAWYYASGMNKFYPANGMK